MSNNTSMNDAIHDVVNKAKTEAATAAPKDLVYLAKTLEAVGPSSELAFITTVGEVEATAIELKSAEGQTAITTAKTAAVTAINALSTADVMPYGKIAQLQCSYGNTGTGGSYRSSGAIGTDGNIYMFGCDNSYHQANGEGTANHSGFHPIQWDSATNGNVAPGSFKKFEDSAYLGMGLTDDGQVWMWGYNGHGQQGVGNTSNLNWGQKAQIPNSETIVDICMGKSGDNNQEATLLALTSNGDVYSWGMNSHGQCGRNGTTNNTSTYLPAKIPGLSNIVRIYAVNGRGAGHCAVIDENGQLYMWGYNNYGQIGSGNTSNSSTPSIPSIALNANEKIVHVQLHGHSYNSTQIVTSEGRMFGCGYNGHGQLSVGNTTQQNSFQLSNWFNGSNDDRRIKLDTTISGGKLVPGTGGIYGEWIAAYMWGNMEYHSNRSALSVSNKLYHWGYATNWCLIATDTSTNSGYPVHSYTGDVQFVSHGGVHSACHLMMNLRDGTVLTGGYNGNYACVTGNSTTQSGWHQPKLPAGVQGNIKCAIARGTSSESCSDWLMEDGTFYTAGYSGEYSQGYAQNTSIASLHFVPWV